MILDGQNVFNNLLSGDSPTAVADNPSGSVLDQMVSGLSFSPPGGGAYVAPWIICRVSVAGVSAGGGTIQAVLQDSPDNITYTDRLLGAVTTAANATKGAVLLATRLLASHARYLRVVWRIATAVFTAGTFTAFLTLDQDVIDISVRTATATLVQTGQITEAVGNSVQDS